MQNQGLREACADILEALTGAPTVHHDPRRVMRLMRGAATLRWAERWEYGDPVPADELQAMVDAATDEAIDAEGGALHREIEALRKLVAPTKLAAHDKRKAARG